MTAKLPVFALCFACAVAAAERSTIFLGVIEPTPLHETAQVRVAFAYQDGQWRAMPGDTNRIHDFPAEVSWTIAFDGRDRGKFRSRAPAQWQRYADVGLQTPDPPVLPLMRDGAAGFSFWNGSPTFRPAAVVSAPNFQDPDRWKSFQPARQEVKMLFATLRKDLGSVTFPCETRTQSGFPDSLIVMEKAYRSASGEELIGLRLNRSAIKKDCDEIPGESWESRWYLVESGRPRPIGQSLELIDAVDYDNDGHSELLFHKSGYNYDGYVLLYDRLRRQATFAWSYQ
jgi:hypothetical protein